MVLEFIHYSLYYIYLFLIYRTVYIHLFFFTFLSTVSFSVLSIYDVSIYLRSIYFFPSIYDSV